jgi:hypothetical protein
VPELTLPPLSGHPIKVRHYRAQQRRRASLPGRQRAD